MKWDQIKKNYPSKWVVLEAIRAYDKGDCRVIDDSSVINVFEQSMDAYREYCKLNKENPNREFLFISTEMSSLSIPSHHWVGIREK